MPYVRYKMMSCVRKYLPVYFIYIVFASAFHLHYHLLGWLRASAQWGARYSKGMAKKETLVSVSRNLHPSMKHPRERRKLCTCLCHMVSCIFFCIQAFSTHMQNYCREEGRYWLNSLAIFIKKIVILYLLCDSWTHWRDITYVFPELKMIFRIDILVFNWFSSWYCS